MVSQLNGVPPHPTTAAQSLITREQRWVLALASLASFVVILDVMVVATSLTTLRRTWGASLSDLQWTVDAYTLSFAVLLMTASALGDRWGRRRVFAAGLALFAFASAACALAPNSAALIAGRTVQGAGAAMVMATALALLNAAFPPSRRGWAIGIYGAVTASAAVAGPVIGGAITQGLGWQWIFWLNVPIGVGAIPFVQLHIKEASMVGAEFDVPGLLLVTGAAFGFVWGLVRADAAGWRSPEVISALGAGVVGAVGVVAWGRQSAHPMIPAGLFRSSAFSAGNAAIFAINASLTGAIFLMPQFEQVVAGQSPLGAGLRLLPWGVVPFLVGPRAGALADRIGERPLIVSGALMQAAGLAWIAVVARPGSAYVAVVVPMSLVGAGLALAIPAATRSVTSNVAPADIGKASGAFATVRQLGGAFGVAILGAAFASSGSYATPNAFSDGFRFAMVLAAAFALAATLPALLTPSTASKAASGAALDRAIARSGRR
jgi:EmrB/QacA subfamily drug resistance transporter